MRGKKDDSDRCDMERRREHCGKTQGTIVENEPRFSYLALRNDTRSIVFGTARTTGESGTGIARAGGVNNREGRKLSRVVV